MAATRMFNSNASRKLVASLGAFSPLQIGIASSVVLHVIFLKLCFVYPNAFRDAKNQALDIILVNSKSAHRPRNAQALAQANLDGGGSTDQNRRAATPLPPSKRQQDGQELEQARKRVQMLEAKQQELLTQSKPSKNTIAKQQGEANPQPAPPVSGRDLMSSALEMARLEGEIARRTDEYNKRPRVKNLGTRTQEYRFARYMEEWRAKVERVGTLNYPEAAKGKLSGTLILTVRIKSDGTVERMDIDKSSGHKVLDDAAKRIVRLAEPYAAFPPDIRRDFDVIEITRTWNFTSSNAVETSVQ